MADSFVIVAVSHASNTASSTRFWTRAGADEAMTFLNRHSSLEALLISDPTPDVASAEPPAEE